MRSIATFDGCHNEIKSKVLIILASRKCGGLSGLSLADIHQQSGISYDSLRASMGKWHKWGYLRRRAGTDGKNQPVYIYSIGKKGKEFISIIPKVRLAEYVTEINSVRYTGRRE